MAEDAMGGVTVAADLGSLTKEVASLLGDDSRKERYLDLQLSALHRGSECLLAAASTGVSATGQHWSDTKAALSEASDHALARILQFAYGCKIQLTEDAHLMELFLLAKRIGLDACAEACRVAISNSQDKAMPISLSMCADDLKRHRTNLGVLYRQSRYLDGSLKVISSGTELFFHRVVLAASSGYFAALWAHSFEETKSADQAVEVDEDASLVKLILLIIYGEVVTVQSPDQLINLLVLADKWQIPSVVNPALAQLEASLLPKDAAQLINQSAQYPQPLFQAILAAINADAQLADELFESNRALAVQLLCMEPSNLPAGLAGRLRLLFSGIPGFGGPEALAGMTPAAMAGVLQSHCIPGEYWWDVSDVANATNLKKGVSLKSPKVYIGSLVAGLNFFPKGSVDAKDGKTSMYVRVSGSCNVRCKFVVNPSNDDSSAVLYHTFHSQGDFGLHNLCNQPSAFKVVGMCLLELTKNNESLLEDVNAISMTLVQWARLRAGKDPHEPLVDLYETLEADFAGKDISCISRASKQAVRTALASIIGQPDFIPQYLRFGSYSETCSSVLGMVALEWISLHLKDFVQSAPWIALEFDQLAIVVQHFMSKCSPSETIIDGIVIWALQGSSTAKQALSRIKYLHVKLKDCEAESPAGAGLDDIIQRATSHLLCVRDNEALELVGEVLGAAGRQEHDGTNSSDSRKRCASFDSDSILAAVGLWGKSHLKRLRTSESWPQSQPVAFAAVAGGQIPEQSEEEALEVVSLWIQVAPLQAVLEALHNLGPAMNRKIYSTLVEAAKQKAVSLQDQNAALGGEGLRAAWGAAKSFEDMAKLATAEALGAKSEIAASHMRATTAEADATAVREQLASAQAELTQLRQFAASVRTAFATHSIGLHSEDVNTSLETTGGN